MRRDSLHPTGRPPSPRRALRQGLRLLSVLLLTLPTVLAGPVPGRAQAGEQVLLYTFHPPRRPARGLPFREPAYPRIGLALSGGGSRGMAHVGTLMALEEAGLAPDYIAGASAGAIVGGLYASGYTPAELAELVAHIDWRALFTDAPEQASLFLGQKEERATYTLQVRLEGLLPILPTSYITGQRVSSLLSDLTFRGEYQADGDFDALRIPFRAVCTDLLTAERVVLDSGSLSQAMLASSAVPVLLAAVRLNGHLLVDGGLVDAVPVDEVVAMGAELVIVSDVSAALRPMDRLNNPLEVVDQVMSITMLGPKQQALQRADLVVAPELPGHLSTDFDFLDTLVTAGYRAAREAIARWEQSASARHRVRLDGVHEGDGPALQVRSVTVGGGSPAQRTRAQERLEGDLLGRVTDPGGLAMAALRLLDDGTLEDDVLRVLAAPDADTLSGRPIEVDLEIDLTSRPLLREIRFEGTTLYDPPELRRALRSRPGEPVDRRTVATDVAALERYYRDRGIPLPVVRQVRFDSLGGVLTFVVDEGIVRTVRFEGLVHTRPLVVRRELPFHEGEPFGALSVQQTIENIYGTGLFERVTIEPARDPAGGLDVLVRVTERPSDRVRLGLHYLEEQQTEGYLEYADENVMGLGGTLGVRGLLGVRREGISFNTRLDRLFRTYLTYQVEGGWRREEVYAYSDDRRSGTYQESGWDLLLAVGQQVRRLGQLRLGLRLENVQAVTTEGIAIEDASHRIRGLELRSIVDTRDRIPFPTRGTRQEFIYETAADALDGSISYVRLQLAMESFFTVGRSTLHPRLFFGTADNTLPAVRWYRLGGMDSFYGYSRDQVRGRQVLLLSGEYRYRIPWGPVAPLVVSLRYDWGGGWAEADSFTLGDMRSGVGIKLSLDSILGPLEVAYGFGEGQNERLYLGFGVRF
jgi:NTE family protein